MIAFGIVQIANEIGFLSDLLRIRNVRKKVEERQII